MHRIDSATRAVNLFGAGKHGYTEGDAPTNVPATHTTADALNAVQEEVLAPIEVVGLAPIKGSNTQLLQALKRLLREQAASNWFARNSVVFAPIEAIAARSTGRLVAVGAVEAGDAIILTSDDGISWTERANTAIVKLNSVAYSDALGLWCAVGDVTGGAATILTSADNGVTWTARASGVAQHLEAVVFGAGLFVAVGRAGTILTSADGTAWTVRVSGVAGDLHAVAWNGTFLLATGDLNGSIVDSLDGITWATTIVSGSNSFRGIAWDGVRWIFVGLAGAVVVSANDLTLVSQLTVDPETTDLHAIAVDSTGLLVIVGELGRVFVYRVGSGLVPQRVATGTLSDVRALAYAPFGEALSGAGFRGSSIFVAGGAAGELFNSHNYVG